MDMAKASANRLLSKRFSRNDSNCLLVSAMTEHFAVPNPLRQTILGFKQQLRGQIRHPYSLFGVRVGDIILNTQKSP